MSRNNSGLMNDDSPIMDAGYMDVIYCPESNTFTMCLDGGESWCAALRRDLGSTNGTWVLGKGRVQPQDVEGEAGWQLDGYGQRVGGLAMHFSI